MPANNSSNGVAPTSKRFQLPALDFKFGSLTDGTNIPPPAPEPKEEQRLSQPKTLAKKEEGEKKKVAEQQLKKEEANGATNGTFPSKPDITVKTNVGLKRPIDEVPISPAPSSRGSLRRLISKTVLNHAYNEQGSNTGQGMSRPPSRTASIKTEEKKAKRNSGWFRRLRHHDNNVSDGKTTPTQSHFEDVKRPTGPPPPMIPELGALETKIDTNLGDDLFKGIGRDS
jgi:hypothetical protein